MKICLINSLNISIDGESQQENNTKMN